MRTILLFMFVAVLGSCGLGSRASSCRGNVSQVSHIATSGPVPDEDQWSERYDISEGKVLFSRTGPSAASDLITGTWEIDVVPEEVTSLFEQLRAIDCSSVQEIPPEVPLDGGGTVIYEIRYEEGDVLSLWYREGTTYTGAEPIVEAIDGFIGRLTLPAEAAVQYRYQLAPD
jgi:hypothetical protein